jgi:hypothetical protein
MRHKQRYIIIDHISFTLKGQFENVKMVVFVELNQDIKPLEYLNQKIEALSL